MQLSVITRQGLASEVSDEEISVIRPLEGRGIPCSHPGATLDSAGEGATLRRVDSIPMLGAHACTVT